MPKEPIENDNVEQPTPTPEQETITPVETASEASDEIPDTPQAPEEIEPEQPLPGAPVMPAVPDEPVTPAEPSQTPEEQDQPIETPENENLPQNGDDFDYDGKIKLSNVDYDTADGAEALHLVIDSQLNDHHKVAIIKQIRDGKLTPDYAECIKRLQSAKANGSEYRSGSEGY